MATIKPTPDWHSGISCLTSTLVFYYVTHSSLSSLTGISVDCLLALPDSVITAFLALYARIFSWIPQP